MPDHHAAGLDAGETNTSAAGRVIAGLAPAIETLSLHHMTGALQHADAATRGERIRMKQLPRLRYWAVVTLAILGCGQEPAQQDSGEAQPSPSSPSSPSSPDVNATQAEPSDSVITPDGWGSLRIGMTRAQVVAAAGEDANPGAVGGPDPETCDEFRPGSAPEGVLVMIRNGVLTRIAVSEGADIRTGSGISVGDTATSVEQAYGARVESKPHAYHAAPGRYMVVWQARPPSPGARGIVYEISETGRVLRILAGDASIEYPEGCV